MNATAAASPQNCWSTGECAIPGEHCFVRQRNDKGGYAQCRRTCPSGWNCEVRANGHCGGAPLPTWLPSAPPEASKLLEPHGVALCDRLAPPIGPHATLAIECYDGGFTGNRYMMIKRMLLRAACCGGVALLPPSFDGLPQSGASCFDFRNLQRSESTGAHACSNSSVNSAAWWSKLPKETPSRCTESPLLRHVSRLAASLHAGFGVAGSAFGASCDSLGAHHHHASLPPLVMHVRSGDIFTAWRDGARTFMHKGYNSVMDGRGQPPLGFYLRAIGHWLATSEGARGSGGGGALGGGSGAAAPEVILVTSPDRASPVVQALEVLASLGALPGGARLRVSASDAFVDDLRLLLCARFLATSASSLYELFVDSPHLRRTYNFRSTCSAGTAAADTSEADAGATTGAGAASADAAKPASPTTPLPCESAPTARHAAVERFCARAAGPYSPVVRWNNSDAQQLEMILGGNATWPVPECTIPAGRGTRI